MAGKEMICVRKTGKKITGNSIRTPPPPLPGRSRRSPTSWPPSAQRRMPRPARQQWQAAAPVSSSAHFGPASSGAKTSPTGSVAVAPPTSSGSTPRRQRQVTTQLIVWRSAELGVKGNVKRVHFIPWGDDGSELRLQYLDRCRAIEKQIVKLRRAPTTLFATRYSAALSSTCTSPKPPLPGW